MQNPSKSTMSDGNKNRSYKVFETLYHRLLGYYGQILKTRHQWHIIEEIKGKTIKLIDSTVISLCLNLFDWAKFRTAKGGLKIRTILEEALSLPCFVNITEAKVADSKGLSEPVFDKGTIVVEDLGYFDFDLFKKRCDAGNVFVTRIKTNTVYKSIEELDLPDKEDLDILKDELIRFTSNKAKESKIDEITFRLVTVYREEDGKVLHIITNQLTWEARTIADLYKKRWDIELFFKIMKQNLQIKTFLGASENTVKLQIYVALICFMLLELIRRVYCKEKPAFSNFCEKVRILSHGRN